MKTKMSVVHFSCSIGSALNVWQPVGNSTSDSVRATLHSEVAILRRPHRPGHVCASGGRVSRFGKASGKDLTP